MPLLEEGQLIRDTYEVERFLGQGAFAEVYRVKHRFLGRQAMKVFKRVGMSLDEIHEMLGEAIGGVHSCSSRMILLPFASRTLKPLRRVLAEIRTWFPLIRPTEEPSAFSTEAWSKRFDGLPWRV